MANYLRSLPGGRPQQGDGHLEALLSGQPLPEDAAAELHGVSELLVALRAAPVDPVERRGQARALDAYRETFARSHPSPQRRRRPAMLSTLLGAKLGAALAAGAVGFGGVAAAAYTGSLPAGLQDLAHSTVGAPAADHGKSADHKPAASTTKTAVGPDAKGPAAFGLCTAWAHAKDSGQAADKSVAFRNLATAAGKKGIAAYCADVPHPGSTATGQPSSHPSGQPSSHPTGKPSTHPTGKPTPLPSHSPSSSGASHRP
jgi:hypothetical protein